MADYSINAVTRRVVYTGSAGVGPYAFSFEVLAATDIAVYKNSTKLTLTTNYTVTINANGTGSVTLTSAATGSDTITIIGSRAIERTTDFVTAGDLLAASLNEQLDSQIVMIQQLAEENKRTLKAPAYDPAAVDDGGTLNMTLPAKATRVGKVLAFNASTGNPEAGPTLSAVQSVANASADIDTVAGSIANVNTVAGNISNVNTVAGVSSNVTTVAGSIANVNTVASDLNEPVSEINTVATSIANVDAVGANIGNVNTVAGISANVTTVAGNSANVTTVAGSIASVNTNAANIVAIQNASANATTATTKAAEASASASAAAASASSASSSASSATASASSASSSATAAASAKTAAESARDATLAAFDSFDDRYLGAKAGDPSVDNDGNALVAGALYFDSTNGIMKIYTGTAWVAAYVSGADFLPTSGGGLTGSLTVDVNSSGNALRITQIGAGNALVVEDSANPDSTPFVVSADGTVIIGNTTTGATLYDVQSLTTDGASYLAQRYAAGTGGTFIRMDKSRGATIGTNTVVVSGDALGTLEYRGADGTGFITAAQISAAVDGTPGTNDMPGRLVFSTTADGASTPTERMRIDSSGNVGIGTASPSSRLDIVGANTIVKSNASSGYGSFYANGATGNAAYYFFAVNSTETARIYSDSANYLAFGTGSSGTERMRIDSSGNVGIGTSSPAKSLTVQASEPMIQLVDADLTTRVANIGGQNGNVTIDIDPAAAAASSQFAVNIDNTERFRIASSGQIGIGGANYGTSGQVLTSNGSGAAPSWASPASTGVNVQTFTSSGTWTKPSLAAGSRVLIQAWGGGGSGGRSTTTYNGGGGGGGYNERWVTLSAMGATETITIGAGGAARTTTAHGNNGGNTTVGSLITAYGGGGGAGGPGNGGGGGAQLSAGANGGTSTAPGEPVLGNAGRGSFDDGCGGYGPSAGLWTGGGGGGRNGVANQAGAASVFGGGGGGGSGGSTAGGASSFGGAGGAGSSSGTATSGSQPGGGGGGNQNGTSGAGGAGQVIITVFQA